MKNLIEKINDENKLLKLENESLDGVLTQIKSEMVDLKDELKYQEQAVEGIIFISYTDRYIY